MPLHKAVLMSELRQEALAQNYCFWSIVLECQAPLTLAKLQTAKSL